MGLRARSPFALKLLFVCADKRAGKGLLTGPRTPAGRFPGPLCAQVLCWMGGQADGQDHPLRQCVWQGGLPGCDGRNENRETRVSSGNMLGTSGLPGCDAQTQKGSNLLSGSATALQHPPASVHATAAWQSMTAQRADHSSQLLAVSWPSLPALRPLSQPAGPLPLHTRPPAVLRLHAARAYRSGGPDHPLE